MQNINYDRLPDYLELIRKDDGQKISLSRGISPEGFEFQVTYGDGLTASYTEEQVGLMIKNGQWKFSKDVYSTDVINTPSHYHKNEIDVNGYLEKHFPLEGSYTVAEGFYIGNVIKYTSRYKDKGGKQDLEKAKFNLNKLIELEEKK